MDLLRHELVLLIVEVAEARRPAVDAVEHLFETHVAHVAVQEVELLVFVLGLVRRAREHRERQIVADDVVPTNPELDGVPASPAREIENDAPFLYAEAVLDEVYLVFDLRV